LNTCQIDSIVLHRVEFILQREIKYEQFKILLKLNQKLPFTIPTQNLTEQQISTQE